MTRASPARRTTCVSPSTVAEGTALVVGLGHPDRGDDAVGPLVALVLEADGLPGVRVRRIAEPAALTALWEGYPTVVVVDAAVGSGEPGDVAVYDATAAPLPAAAARPVSSHGLDLVTVVETARLLGGLPQRLLLVAITGSRVALGEPPQPRVRAAVPAAAERVRELLRPGTTG